MARLSGSHRRVEQGSAGAWKAPQTASEVGGARVVALGGGVCRLGYGAQACSTLVPQNTTGRFTLGEGGANSPHPRPPPEIPSKSSQVRRVTPFSLEPPSWRAPRFAAGWKLVSQGRRKTSVSRSKYPGALCLQAEVYSGPASPSTKPQVLCGERPAGAELPLMGLGKPGTPEIYRELHLVGNGGRFPSSTTH